MYNVYLAFSGDLNRESYRTEFKGLWLVKIGYSTDVDGLEQRFNEGFKCKKDPDNIRRSLPLALCKDWKVISHRSFDNRDRALSVEKALHNWCRSEFGNVVIRSDIERKMRQQHSKLLPQYRYTGNGLGEIWYVRIDENGKLGSKGRCPDTLGAEILNTALTKIARKLSENESNMIKNFG